MSKYLIRFWEDISILKEIEVEAESKEEAYDIFYEDSTLSDLGRVVELYPTETCIDEIKLIEK